MAMHRLAMMILRDEEIARDIVHDIFETLLAGNLAGVSEAYLLKAVRNRCLSHIRSLGVRERVKQLYAADFQENPDEEWPDEDTIALIRSTVASELGETCRKVVDMRFAGGMRYKDIAAELRVSEVAVYKHLRHAIDVIRKKLSKDG